MVRGISVRSRTAALIVVPCAAVAACSGSSGSNEAANATASGSTVTVTRTAAATAGSSANESAGQGSSAPSTSTVTSTADPTDTPQQGTGTASSASSAGASSSVPITLAHKVWPTSGWTVTRESEDLCGGGSGGQSVYATTTRQFSCGPTAASLLVCRATGDQVTCIQDYATRRAVRFTSDTVRPSGYALPAEPSPLQVRLANGKVCNTVSHDQAEHYDGRQGWLYCGGSSLILTDKATQTRYFDKSKPRWTADYAVGTAAPTKVGVLSIVYAG